MRHTCLVVAFCSLALPSIAADGVLIVQRTTTGDNARTARVQIEGQRMRVDMIGEANAPQVVIFDATKQVMWLIDSSRKTYSEMTKADLDRMSGQMNAAMAKMQEQLANLPPAQRAQFEAMMKGRGMPGMPASPVQPTEYREAGTDRVGEWTCLKYVGVQNDRNTSELCTVELKELGLLPADFAVSRQFAEFFRGLMPQTTEVFSVGTPEEQGFSGVPVRRIDLQGSPQTITEIVEITRETFSDSLFAVPEGFERQAMPGAGRGR